MSEKVLFVDDDVNLLSSYKRQMHNQFVLETASNGVMGLDSLKTKGPFAVIVSDMGMSEMYWIEFISQVKDVSSDVLVPRGYELPFHSGTPQEFRPWRRGPARVVPHALRIDG